MFRIRISWIRYELAAQKKSPNIDSKIIFYIELSLIFPAILLLSTFIYWQ